MNDFLGVTLSILLSFGLGAGVWFWVLRGFLPAWMQAKRGKGFLLEVLRRSGGQSSFVVAKPRKDNVGEYVYKLDGVEHYVSPVGVRRLLRVPFAQVLEGDTAPLPVAPEKVVLKESVDSDGNKVLLAQGWLHEDDSSIIANYIHRAGTKPKIPGLAGFNLKVLLPILIGLGILVFMLMQAGGGNPVI